MGQELFKVIEWFLEKNTRNKAILKKTDITLEVYQKINKSKMCLTSEMRTCFLGINDIMKITKSPLDLNPEV